MTFRVERALLRPLLPLRKARMTTGKVPCYPGRARGSLRAVREVPAAQGWGRARHPCPPGQYQAALGQSCRAQPRHGVGSCASASGPQSPSLPRPRRRCPGECTAGRVASPSCAAACSPGPGGPGTPCARPAQLSGPPSRRAAPAQERTPKLARARSLACARALAFAPQPRRPLFPAPALWPAVPAPTAGHRPRLWGRGAPNDFASRVQAGWCPRGHASGAGDGPLHLKPRAVGKRPEPGRLAPGRPRFTPSCS